MATAWLLSISLLLDCTWKEPRRGVPREGVSGSISYSHGYGLILGVSMHLAAAEGFLMFRGTQSPRDDRS